MKLKILSLVILAAVTLAAVIVSGCTGSGSAGEQASADKGADFALVITGGEKSPVNVTLTELKALKQVRKDVFYCDRCEMSGDRTPYYGPSTVSVLEKAGLPAGDYSLRVSSPDGLNITYTRAQVEDSIIALRKNQTELTGSAENGITFVYAGGDSMEWITQPVRLEILPAYG